MSHIIDLLDSGLVVISIMTLALVFSFKWQRMCRKIHRP